ncbi:MULTISPECIES: hypothetical protein [Microcystis]|uniref:hypothetical protein n=1 Tax=Microcystis TaxID=1125 RepID=UPI0010574EED|nr:MULTISPECIES: hypothetical protein [Microcystis]MCA2718903.1 hypothetical protein [Microcystis sp. M169S2]WNF15878.1 hypothetical protein RKE53_05580 [Microcystis aeruginosa NRERC-214]
MDSETAITNTPARATDRKATETNRSTAARDREVKRRTTHRSLISRSENLINCLKCGLAKALSILLEYLLVQKDHFEVNELIGV